MPEFEKEPSVNNSFDHPSSIDRGNNNPGSEEFLPKEIELVPPNENPAHVVYLPIAKRYSPPNENPDPGSDWAGPRKIE